MRNIYHQGEKSEREYNINTGGEEEGGNYLGTFWDKAAF
jgi:hypothetical protein